MRLHGCCTAIKTGILIGKGVSWHLDDAEAHAHSPLTAAFGWQVHAQDSVRWP